MHLKAHYSSCGYKHQRQLYKSFTDAEGVSSVAQVLHDPKLIYLNVMLGIFYQFFTLFIDLVIFPTRQPKRKKL